MTGRCRRPPPRQPPRPTPAPAAARRSRSTSGCARRCNPLGLRDVGQLAGPRDGLRRGRARGRRAGARRPASRCRGIGPFPAEVLAVEAATVMRCRVTLAVTNDGTSLGSTTCRVSNPAIARQQAAFVQSPRIEPRRTLTFDADRDRLGLAAADPRGRVLEAVTTPPRPTDLAFALDARPRRPAGSSDGPLRARRADRLQERPRRRHRGRPPHRGARSSRRSATAYPGDGILAEESGAHPTSRGGGVRRPATGASGSSTRSTARSTTPTASRSSASRSASSSTAGPSSASSSTRPATSCSRRPPTDRRRSTATRSGVRQGQAVGLRRLDGAVGPVRREPGAGDPQGRSGSRARWARRRSASPTSRTAGSTRSSSRAGCRPGTSPRPG